MSDGVDPRPRPQYGEYATPEEQRARIRQPDVTHALDTGAAPAATAPAPEATAAVHAPAPVAPTDEAVPAVRRRPIDRVVSIGLLVYGFITVITSFPALVDYAAYAERVLTMLGVDAELSDPGAGRPWGIAAGLVLVIGWLVTATITWWNMSRARISWWIPLLGGILFTFIAGVLMLVPLSSDPALWDAMLESTR